jgi:hypothetical protein
VSIYLGTEFGLRQADVLQLTLRVLRVPSSTSAIRCRPRYRDDESEEVCELPVRLIRALIGGPD